MDFLIDFCRIKVFNDSFWKDIIINKCISIVTLVFRNEFIKKEETRVKFGIFELK